MLQLSQELSCGDGRLRIDLHDHHPVDHVLEDTTFLSYRLADVQIESKITRPSPDIVWYRDLPEKSIHYNGQTLTLKGAWFEGELQKTVVSLLALRVESLGLHPFHASAIRYRDRTIMFLGGQSNRGKTMSQIEGSRRGGLVVSTETTIVDERGWAVMGSKNVFLRKRAKGTERSDKLDQDKGVARFFDERPKFINYNQPSNVDLVILPDIDGNFDVDVLDMVPFEKEYQTYHSLMDYFGLHDLLAPGLAMPIIDTDSTRGRRSDFCHRFCERPYYIIRGKTPQQVMDGVDGLLHRI